MIDVTKLNFLSQSLSKALQLNQIVYVEESELVVVVVCVHTFSGVGYCLTASRLHEYTVVNEFSVMNG